MAKIVQKPTCALIAGAGVAALTVLCIACTSPTDESLEELLRDAVAAQERMAAEMDRSNALNEEFLALMAKEQASGQALDVTELVDLLAELERLEASQSTPAQPAAESGICRRTPEVQQEILEELGRSSCKYVDADELYRIRSLSINGLDGLRRGDLAGLVNLEYLALDFDTGSLKNDEVITISPEAFDGLRTETLNLDGGYRTLYDANTGNSVGSQMLVEVEGFGEAGAYIGRLAGYHVAIHEIPERIKAWLIRVAARYPEAVEAGLWSFPLPVVFGYSDYRPEHGDVRELGGCIELFGGGEDCS